MKPRLVVFDLDDTLYLEREYVRSGLSAVADFLSREHHLDGFLATSWQIFLEGARGDIFDRTLVRMGHVPNAELVQSLVGVYRHHHPTIAPCTGAQSILERLHDCAKIGLISDGHSLAQQRKFEALKLNAWFDYVTFTDLLGRDFWKPHPRAFVEMQSASALAGECCLYIGDNPAKDFVAPRRLGWKSVRLRLPGGINEALEPLDPASAPDVTVTSWWDLGNWLAGLCTQEFRHRD
jgi:putative hydrolase of the HAD superfamily